MILSKDISLESSVEELWKVGPKTAEKLKKLGILRVRDLLTHFPTRYEDLTEVTAFSFLKPGMKAVIRGKVQEIELIRTRRTNLVKALIIEEGLSIEAVWFNQPYIVDTIKRGQFVYLTGRVNIYRDRLNFQVTDFTIDEDKQDKKSKEVLLHVGRIVPIYPETAGISSKWLRYRIKTLFPLIAETIEVLPEFIRQKYDLCSFNKALKWIHFPANKEQIKKARYRLAFEELFYFQFLLAEARKRREKTKRKYQMEEDKFSLNDFEKTLPFTLTGGQRKIMQEIARDLKSTTPMKRILLGDVGSGKTVIAAFTILKIVKVGLQAVVMAPTELLAEQLYDKLCSYLPNLYQVGLLTGSKGKITVGEKDLSLLSLEKEAKYSFYDPELVKEKARKGDLSVLVGTHAVIQEEVKFKKLALAIVDEQHRFGVSQRSLLKNKGENIDFLMMTATPIPRSLALGVFGDLEVSFLDEMPRERKKIVTRLVPANKRRETYDFLKKVARAGQQGFIVFPLVEESEKMNQVKAASEQWKKLGKEWLKDYRLGLLHGQMKSVEQEEVMRKFLDQEYDFLICTTVIEVGIDVPNASVILIENAECFGLAQLHQLRGRVGRRGKQGFCFVFSDNKSPKTQKRLSYFEKCLNGFNLAEKDLEMRGPGELLGCRQSGLPDFHMASLSDLSLVNKVKKAVIFFLSKEKLAHFPVLEKNIRKFEKREWVFC